MGSHLHRNRDCPSGGVHGDHACLFQHASKEAREFKPAIPHKETWIDRPAPSRCLGAHSGALDLEVLQVWHASKQVRACKSCRSTVAMSCTILQEVHNTVLLPSVTSSDRGETASAQRPLALT